jgi:hypothetical protein
LLGYAIIISLNWMSAHLDICPQTTASESAVSNSIPILADFLTVEELAIELRRNRRTLDRWQVLGIGPPRTHIGRKVLYRRESVQKWLAAQESQRSVS